MLIYNRGNSLKQDEDKSKEDGDEPEAKRRKLDNAKSPPRKRRFGPVWMIPHLIKSLKFLQTKILHVSGRVLETANWSRGAKARLSGGHQPFLQLVLTCLRELESLNDGKSRPQEDREQVNNILIENRLK